MGIFNWRRSRTSDSALDDLLRALERAEAHAASGGAPRAASGAADDIELPALTPELERLSEDPGPAHSRV